MNNITDNQRFLSKCKELVEDKLNWGDSGSWQSQDFEKLSELIFEETGVVLSTSTLKRIWGKVKYESSPSSSTLDAVACFIGYSDWRAFRKSYTEAGIEAPVKVIGQHQSLRIIPVFVMILVLCTITGFIILMKSHGKLSYNNISFSSRPVIKGVPNTVVFQYDASNSNADSVFIQQSWDTKRRFRVDKHLHEYSSIYELPGYYRAKLVLNDSIVKEHDLFIESSGWLGLFRKGSQIAYLSKKLYDHETWLGIHQKDLQIDFTDHYATFPDFILTNVSKDFKLHSEDFDLQMELQNTLDHPNARCKKANVLILGTEGVINIPLSSPGCVGGLVLRIGDTAFTGETKDMSAFGVDFSKPVQFKLFSASDKIRIELNEKRAYDGVFDKKIGYIAGVRITFQGSGLIRSFQLK